MFTSFTVQTFRDFFLWGGGGGGGVDVFFKRVEMFSGELTFHSLRWFEVFSLGLRSDCT